MGGLFSSKPETPQRRPTQDYRGRDYAYQSNVRASPPVPVTGQLRHNSYGGATYNFESLTIQPPRLSRPIPTVPSIRHQPAPERSQHNSSIFDISLDPNYNVGSVVTFTELPSYDSEYRVVTNMITNKRNFKVDRIDKIANPYLIKAYELKREQKRLQHADAFVEERLLFHGTKRANVDAICKMNFDWRRCKAHEYGKGVSFSPNSTYSSNYSDPGLDNKVMLVAKVLVANSCIGNKFMELPPDGYDTSQKGEDGVVIVKYEDSEFYPAYKISYHVLDENFGKGNRYKSRGRRII
ncbi:hypothetical protein MTP99_000797 [Tenebrio molitor]|jgi:hypothetical protein|uniref:Poly [ADP-ribose] polymerase n=1 Tax=Tenebrio molitor TaxID=7067 RepID=A0A8J6H512_TENMO|nr:hypothetical protein GEV33_014921 [Tenebrio molitor]KAJ3637326.1 hypothetical protein MTP99_000797 [Tenebrio molitor]